MFHDRKYILILFQLLGSTLDNAANNIVMLKELQAIVPEFRGLEGHVRCFGHILNLVVKVCRRA